ncbi:hypothetical protein SAMN05421788_106185 [Filimonas lacunae]|uniref:Uncharacterized protein n=1 Tax=Filimonas lacunae TaxID=477680 RepID=A0A173MEX9_9BACT|nr:hypothetical protein [Filimonas lacunae]BAV06125.1 hypothetical protein FLA_2140 [Filimonas lacunae]SIT24766.1 hypothetical protein SAMN05421788_106185 [Filimonas lacunae]
MKMAKVILLMLLVSQGITTVSAQMIRNKAVFFKRHRITHHHHIKH